MVSASLFLSISLHMLTPFPSLSLIHGHPSANIHYLPPLSLAPVWLIYVLVIVPLLLARTGGKATTHRVLLVKLLLMHVKVFTAVLLGVASEEWS